MAEEKRLLTRDEAAAYCGISKTTFSHWVQKGTLPKSVAGSRRWDKRAIDSALDGLVEFNKQPNIKPGEFNRSFRESEGRIALAAARATLRSLRKDRK